VIGWLLDTDPDLIISATALHHGLTVVTRNTADKNPLTPNALGLKL
jgi:predicted nucleic acid-binding protein